MTIPPHFIKVGDEYFHPSDKRVKEKESIKVYLDTVAKAHQPKPAKRLRQSSRPLMNKLEAEFYEVLKEQYHPSSIYPQAIKWRLGNGIVYTSDFVVIGPYPIHAYEVKGPFAHRGGFENLKVAAGIYRQVRFVLAWKDKATKQWQEQIILP